MKNAQSAMMLQMVAITALLAGAVLMPMAAQADSGTNTKTKYSYSGKDASAWQANSTGCGWEEAYIQFSELSFKTNNDKSASENGYFFLYADDWCSTDSWKYCSGNIDLSGSNTAKENAHIRGTGTVQCFGDAGTWVEDISVAVDLICYDEYISTSKYKSRYSYSGPWGTTTYSDSGKGTYCEADAAGTITGSNINVTFDNNSYGYIGDWKDKYRVIEEYKP